MLWFHTLLDEAGLDPQLVQLVRHQDTRKTALTSPYSVWRADRESFLEYQKLQSKARFAVPGVIASFVVPPNGETLFVGLFDVTNVSPNSALVKCPVSHQTFPPHTMNIFDLKPRSEMSELAGRMTIEWSGRNWIQRAHTQQRSVLEIRRFEHEPPFPNVVEFSWLSNELFAIPPSWQAVLRTLTGVYLLVSELTGDQYVGSATGDGGFWSRWEAYGRDGHGGNVLLRARGKPPYRISILETASSAATRTEVIAIEQRWKQRLGTRAFGLNLN
jgi:hypothetical protein